MPGLGAVGGAVVRQSRRDDAPDRRRKQVSRLSFAGAVRLHRLPVAAQTRRRLVPLAGTAAVQIDDAGRNAWLAAAVGAVEAAGAIA